MQGLLVLLFVSSLLINVDAVEHQLYDRQVNETQSGR